MAGSHQVKGSRPKHLSTFPLAHKSSCQRVLAGSSGPLPPQLADLRLTRDWGTSKNAGARACGRMFFHSTPARACQQVQQRQNVWRRNIGPKRAVSSAKTRAPPPLSILMQSRSLPRGSTNMSLHVGMTSATLAQGMARKKTSSSASTSARLSNKCHGLKSVRPNGPMGKRNGSHAAMLINFD